MNCCKSPSINDFSFYKHALTIHKYCTRCGSHQYDGEVISKSDWSDWIENGEDGEGYSKFRSRQNSHVITS